jgi:hemerythrin-like domain-containing protein
MFTTDHGREYAGADFLHTLQTDHLHSEALLRQLATTVEAIGGSDLTEAQRDALELRLQSFLHHPLRCTDEETSLFTRMRNQAGLEIQRVCRKLDALEEDFWQARFYAERTERIIRYWMDQYRLTRSDYAVLSSALNDLCRLYRKHIQIEKEEVYPAAERVLSENL